MAELSPMCCKPSAEDCVHKSTHLHFLFNYVSCTQLLPVLVALNAKLVNDWFSFGPQLAFYFASFCRMSIAGV